MQIKQLNKNEVLNNKADWGNKVIVVTPNQLSNLVNPEIEHEIIQALDFLTENKLENCDENFLATFTFQTNNEPSDEMETVALYSDFETFSIYITNCKTQLIKMINSVLTENSTPSSLFMSILERLTEFDHVDLEKLEDEMDDLQDNIEEENNLQLLNKKVNGFRRTLLEYKHRYDQFLNIVEFFKVHKYTIDSEEEQDKFEILDRRIPKLRNEVLYLRDIVAQLRDSCQVQFNARQNTLMRVFTIVTAIVLPLQLIAGWYGMNFSMPEFGWKYSYPVVCGVCAVVMVCLLIFFHKKRWFK